MPTQTWRAGHRDPAEQRPDEDKLHKFCIRILSAADVRAALPMPKAIDAMRHAYSQLSAGNVTAPPRQHISTDKGVTLIMPAYLPERNDFGVKVVSVYDGNPNLDLPRITATVLVPRSSHRSPKSVYGRCQPDCHPNRCRWWRGSRPTGSTERENRWTLRRRCASEGAAASSDGSQRHRAGESHQPHRSLRSTTRR